MFAVIITSYKILATKQEKGTFILLVLGILWNNTKIGSSIYETRVFLQYVTTFLKSSLKEIIIFKSGIRLSSLCFIYWKGIHPKRPQIQYIKVWITVKSDNQGGLKNHY